jgi:putative hydrolase of the HAD superfamily
VKAIVFDLGAVVVRWRPAVLLSSVLPHRAPTPEAAEPLVREFFQDYQGDWGEFDRGTVSVPELVQRMSERLGLAPGEVQRVVDAVPDELQPLPDTVDLIERLRAGGHRLYFLSNMPAPYADHLERALPFARWFDGGVFSSRVQRIKPDPAIFRLLAEAQDLSPAQTLFIDDSLRNVEAARALGWHAHHFVGAPALAAELRARSLLG